MEIGGVAQGAQPDISVKSTGNSQIGQSKTVSENRDSFNLSTTANLSIASKTTTDTLDKTVDVKNAVDKLNKFLEDNATHAVYEPNQFFKSVVTIKIVDDTTGQVIQEIPPKKILDMVQKMMEMVGVLFDKKA